MIFNVLLEVNQQVRESGVIYYTYLAYKKYVYVLYMYTDNNIIHKRIRITIIIIKSIYIFIITVAV